MIKKIISGGQTGVDRAALDFAIEAEISHGGWCPRGRVAEDGMIDSRYELLCPEDGELVGEEKNIYAERTKLNIRDSDATLLIVPSFPLPITVTDGTCLTIEEIRKQNKLYYIVDLSKLSSNIKQTISKWVNSHNIELLNIAGPRESQHPGIYRETLSFLKLYLYPSLGIII